MYCSTLVGIASWFSFLPTDSTNLHCYSSGKLDCLQMNYAPPPFAFTISSSRRGGEGGGYGGEWRCRAQTIIP